MKIPLLDLEAQYRSVEAAVRARIEQVFRTQHFILGPEVAELEHEVECCCQVEYAVGVASGTDALLLSLLALGIGPGDEVITTPFTFFATASTIVQTGARPVFVDIELETGLISPGNIEAAITPRTRAIVPVHLFGQCADMDPILALAQARNLAVLEDACQAIAAEYHGRRAGSMGDAGALSFYPSKNLGGAGDGGMVLTRRADIADKVRRLHVYGAYQENGRQFIGTNSRLDSLQAAILLAKLPSLPAWTERRRAHAARYDERFRGTPVKPLLCHPSRFHVYNNYVIRIPRRDELAAFLTQEGIGTRIYYPQPLHLMPCFQHYTGPVSLPAAEEAAASFLALPCYPEMTEEMVDTVAETVLSFFAAGPA